MMMMMMMMMTIMIFLKLYRGNDLHEQRQDHHYHHHQYHNPYHLLASSSSSSSSSSWWSCRGGWPPWAAAGLHNFKTRRGHGPCLSYHHHCHHHHCHCHIHIHHCIVTVCWARELSFFSQRETAQAVREFYPGDMFSLPPSMSMSKYFWKPDYLETCEEKNDCSSENYSTTDGCD